MNFLGLFIERKYLMGSTKNLSLYAWRSPGLWNKRFEKHLHSKDWELERKTLSCWNVTEYAEEDMLKQKKPAVTERMKTALYWKRTVRSR